MRQDLPEAIRRRLLWHRRQECRRFGHLYDKLIDAHIDPHAWLEEVHAAHRRALRKQ